MENKENKYQIEVTESQARLIIESLDLVSRLLIGQTSEISRVFEKYDFNRVFNSLNPSMKEGIAYLLKMAFFPELVILGDGASYSILNDKVPDEARQAYDIIQVVRNRLAFDNNPKGGFQVDFDPPYKTSEKQNLPTIKKIIDNSQ